jgi:hypothetical protein
MDAPPGRVHLRAQHPVAGAGGQAEAAVHAGVCGVCGGDAQCRFGLNCATLQPFSWKEELSVNCL